MVRPKQTRKRVTRRRKSTTRGGSQRANTNRERILRGWAEMDRANMEFWQAKVDSLEQDVEVLERKLTEQRANNAPARKQLHEDLTKKKEKMRVAKHQVEIYREVLERGLKELAALDAAT